MPQRLRIFISSPADVADERLRAALVVDKLALDYGRFFALESYRWEHEAMLASAHFQDAIEPPSAFDIVVLILWSRLGTPLPEKTAEREYRGIDGRAPVTGTEWEYEEALEVAREKKAPDLLAFRNISPAPIDPRDPAAQAGSMAQLNALNEFWARHFAHGGVFLAAYDEYRTLEEFARRLEESLRKLIERRIKDASTAEARSDPIWLGDPFRGLESYEFEYAPIFFGRDAAIAKATEQLAANARDGHAFLLISGASGSGKSSLAKAGIVPRLMKPQRISGAAFLRRVVFRPAAEDSDVFLGLAKALTRSEGSDIGLPELIAPGQDTSQLAAHLGGGMSDYLFANALGRLTESSRQSGRILNFEDAKLLLVIDQLEELFTAPGIGPQERRIFMQLLGGLARSGAVWVIATLRADFWHRASDIPELIALAEGQGRIDLAAPSAAELAEMIRKPAQAAGLSFEAHPDSGLGLDAVLAEHAAAEPGALPLLSFTLDELYRRAKAHGATTLTHASYETLGGIEGAIAQRADEIMFSLPAAAQAALPRVLRALTTVTETAEQTPVARAAPLDNFPPGSPARTLIDAFVAARLLVASDESGGGASVRLAHEALIGRWQRARDQLMADRRDLQTRTLVERQCARWSQASGAARRLLLLRNPDLANAIDLERRWGDELDAPMRDFIERSARRARLVQTFTAAAAALFALVAGGAIYAQRQAVRSQHEADAQRQVAVGAKEQAEKAAQQALQAQHEAQDQRRSADQQRDQALLTQSRFLANLANQRVQEGDAATAMAVAIEALPADANDSGRPFSPEAEAALFNGLQYLLEHPQLNGHNAIDSAAFSPDGHRVVTAMDDNTAIIWDAATGNPVATLKGHESEINTVAFSADGRLVVTAADDATARVWEAENGKQLAVLQIGNFGSVESAAFSPDGRTIAGLVRTGKGQAHLYIWDAKTGNSVAEILEARKTFAYSPDGQRIVAAFDDNTVRILDATSGKQMVTLKGHTNTVTSAAFSPDGLRVVTVSDDDTVWVWDAKSGKQVTILRDKDLLFSTAAFSADGQRIITVASLTSVYQGERAIIWDAKSGRQLLVLSACRTQQAAFAPNGKVVLVVCQDGSAHLADIQSGETITTFAAGDAKLISAAFSSDGESILTMSDNHTARIWDLVPAKELVVLRGHEKAETSAQFSPDGSRIITASFDYTARLWEADSGKQIAILKGHTAPVVAAAFSPDGERAVTASQDNTVRIWEAGTGRQIVVLEANLGAAYFVEAMFSPDGRRVLAWSQDDKTFLWDLADTSHNAVLIGGEARFSPDGLRVVTVSGKTAQIWDATIGKQLATLTGHTGDIHHAVFSPNGKLVVTASADDTARLWDVQTGKQIALLQEDAGTKASEEVGTHELQQVAFSPDGRRVIIGSTSGMAIIWDVDNDTQISIMADQARYLQHVGFSADGRQILTDGPSGTRLWDASSKTLLATLNTGMWAVSQDMRRLVGTTDDQGKKDALAVWRLFPITAGLLDYAKSVIPGCLTEQERGTAFLDPAPPAWCIELAKWPYNTEPWQGWLKDTRAGKKPPLPKQ